MHIVEEEINSSLKHTQKTIHKTYVHAYGNIRKTNTWNQQDEPWGAKYLKL